MFVMLCNPNTWICGQYELDNYIMTRTHSFFISGLDFLCQTAHSSVCQTPYTFNMPFCNFFIVPHAENAIEMDLI